MPDFVALGDEHAYFKSNQLAVDLLGSITAADKALAVPYIKLWQVKADGTPVHKDSNNQPTAPISLLLVQPPAFGASVAGRFFTERPPVSLERISIKTEMSYGLIQFRHITLNFVVHRPDIIFDEKNDDFDNWSSLIIPGTMHALKYGWSGASANDILNGNGLQDADNQVEGQRTILFTVTNYSFTINSDGSINVNITALENGDNVLNRLTLSDEQFYEDGGSDEKGPTTGGAVKESGTATGQVLLQKIQQDFDKLKRTKHKKQGHSIQFKDILNSICAPTMEAAFKRAGYKQMEFKIGKFNKNVGSTAKQFGGPMGAHDIWDFEFPESMVKDALAAFKRDGGQLNIRVTLEYFLNQMMDASAWSTGLTDSEKQQAKQNAAKNPDGGATDINIAAAEAAILVTRVSPQLHMKTTSTLAAGEQKLLFYIIDLKSEVVTFDDTDKLETDATRDEIKEKLKNRSVPMISFRSGLSFIQDSRFEVQQDPLMKSIMIQQYFSPTTRNEQTQISHAAQLQGKPDPRQLIYSSALDGNITMLGNFVFDTFALVWLDFGIPRWDGTFYVMEKEDVLQRGEFISTYKFKSAGDDPLGTQGRITKQQVASANAAAEYKKQSNQPKGRKKKGSPYDHLDK